MGSITRKIDEIIQEHGSWEAYEAWLNSRPKSLIPTSRNPPPLPPQPPLGRLLREGKEGVRPPSWNPAPVPPTEHIKYRKVEVTPDVTVYEALKKGTDCLAIVRIVLPKSTGGQILTLEVRDSGTEYIPMSQDEYMSAYFKVLDRLFESESGLAPELVWSGYKVIGLRANS